MKPHEIPAWFPAHPAIYDINKSYAENADLGPFFTGEIPKRALPPKDKWIDFLGYSVASPIGVPAGPLLTANWISLAAKLGFDIPTYKTIRSRPHASHPLPNMIFIDTNGMLNLEKAQHNAMRVDHPNSDIETLAVTNSFGMPSKDPKFLMVDIPKANASLQEGQVMIVSIVGTPREDIGFLEDFVAAARLAKEAGAKIIEANFSCPNVDKKEGCLYTSPQVVKDFASAIVKEIHPIPLIIKVGLFTNPDHMRDVMITAAKSGVRAVSGINTVSMKVVDDHGHPALGPARISSGICGGPIREVALEFMRQANRINKQEKLDLTLIGVGGITLPEHFDQFLEAGAQIAQSATGMMWDPYLAMRYHATHSL